MVQTAAIFSVKYLAVEIHRKKEKAAAKTTDQVLYRLCEE